MRVWKTEQPTKEVVETMPLMTGDVARLAGRSTEVVLYHVRQGRLTPHMTPGGRRIYDPADVARFLAELRARPARRKPTEQERALGMPAK
jgi:hypothetical protein